MPLQYDYAESGVHSCFSGLSGHSEPGSLLCSRFVKSKHDVVCHFAQPIVADLHMDAAVSL